MSLYGVQGASTETDRQVINKECSEDVFGNTRGQLIDLQSKTCHSQDTTSWDTFLWVEFISLISRNFLQNIIPCWYFAFAKAICNVIIYVTIYNKHHKLISMLICRTILQDIKTCPVSLWPQSCLQHWNGSRINYLLWIRDIENIVLNSKSSNTLCIS